MLQLNHGLRTGLTVLTVGMCLALAGPAASKSMYAWETEDGVSNFTDDEKQIPRRYKAVAKRQTLRSLNSYERFTPSDRKASGDYAERLRSRLSKARETARVSTPTAGWRHHGGGVRGGVQVSGRDRGAVGVGFRGDRDGGPIEVDSYRVRVGSEIATRHATVVSQDGQVLTVIRDEPNVSNITYVPRIKSGGLQVRAHKP
jgi:hypothetical protein